MTNDISQQYIFSINEHRNQNYLPFLWMPLLVKEVQKGTLVILTGFLVSHLPTTHYNQQKHTRDLLHADYNYDNCKSFGISHWQRKMPLTQLVLLHRP